MSRPGFTVDRAMVSHIPGAFIAFGHGPDIDRAFDSAVTVERFELGTSGTTASLADLDPAAPRSIMGEPVHPYVAMDQAVGALPTNERGRLIAIAVTSMSAWKHERLRVRIDGIEYRLPDAPGLLLPLETGLRGTITSTMSGEDATRIVGVELLAAARQRYKVKATGIKGPRKAGYAIFDAERLIEVHPNISLARKAAIVMAKTGSGTMRLSIRPWIGRNEEAGPYVVVERSMVSQKAAVRVHLATEKRPEKRKCVGWIFAGRLPR